MTDLNERFVAALKDQLFSPSKTTPMLLMDPYSGRRGRSYRPILYQIIREVGHLHDDAVSAPVRPLQMTIVHDPVVGTDEGS